MNDTTFLRALEWRNIRFSQESVSQIERRQIVESIPRSEVTRIVLCRGREQQQIHFSVCAVLVMAIITLLPKRLVLLWLFHSGTVVSGTIWLTLIIVIGAEIIYRWLKRAYYLEVESRDGTRKILFRGNPRVRDIDTFLRSVEDRYGYQIERAVPTSGFPISKEGNGRADGKLA